MAPGYRGDDRCRVLRPHVDGTRQALPHRPEGGRGGGRPHRRAPRGRGHRHSAGQGVLRGAGGQAGIRRFADATVPLDEALAHCVVDLAGRPVVCSGSRGQEYALIGGSGVPFAGSMTQHDQSFAMNAGICVHMRLLAGRDPHHIVEAQFKALARALRFAVEVDPRTEEPCPRPRARCDPGPSVERGCRTRCGLASLP